MPRFPFRGRARFRTKRERQITDEIRFYLEMRALEFERDGMAPDAAREAARQAFGDLREIEGECAAVEPEPPPAGVRDSMHQLVRDFILTLRSFRRTPFFYASAIATAGLGIGANTAIFSIFNWAHFGHAPGVVESTELRTLRLSAESGGAFPWSYATYAVMRDGMRTMSDLVAFETFDVHVAVQSDAERIGAEVIAGPYFRTLGLIPARGRFFTDEELSVPALHAVVVVSDRYWRRHFGEAAAIEDARVTLNGRIFDVIGVTQPGFHGAIKPGKTDVWISVMMHDVVLPTYSPDILESHREGTFFQMLGRRVGTASLATIRAEIETLVAGIEGHRSSVLVDPVIRVTEGATPFRWDVDRLAQVYRLMTGVVVLVLLIASANVANLLLARAASRRQEIAVQMALGVSQGQLIRRQLVESLCIAAAGAAVGLLVAQTIIDLLRGSGFGSGSLGRLLPALGDIPFDGRVFLFTMGLTVLTAVAVGLVPAIAGPTRDAASALRSGRGIAGRSRFELRTVLAGVQMAVSMILLVTAGLFLRTINNLHRIDYGLDADRIVTFGIDPGTNGYEDERVLPFYRELLEHIRAEPGVEAAAVTWRGVFGWMGGMTSLQDPTQHPADEYPLSFDLDAVGRDYFTSLDMAFVEGRDFTDAETFTRDTRTLVMNQAAANVLWPNQSAVGRTVHLRYPNGEAFTVVGVVEDVQLSDPMLPPEPAIYVPLAYAWIPTWATISVRYAPGAPARVPSDVVRRMDPSLPIYNSGTIAAIAEARFGEQRLVAKLTGIFAVLAVTLALVGLYGVVSYSVQQRQRELGIRMALGAKGHSVMGLVLRRAFAIAAWGAAGGLAGAVGVGALVQNRLYGVPTLDPLSIAGASLALTAGVVLASALPARRAGRVDPIAILRSE